MINLLIPTDFTPASVRMAERAVLSVGRKANIILFHAFEMPQHQQDFIRNTTPYAELMNDTFRQSCKGLKEQYPHLIGTISFKFMMGDTGLLFRNFIEANEVDMIVLPQDYQFVPVHKTSVNPCPLFKRSKVPLLQELTPKERIMIRNGQRVSVMAAAS